MQIEIIEKDCRTKKDEESKIKQKLLSYRVSLVKYSNNKIVLTREYFRYGFLDGEAWDGIFMNYNSDGIYRVSIITHNLDSIYLSQIEEKVIKKFISESYKSIEKLNNKLIQTKKNITESIEKYSEIVEFLPNYSRTIKILKIKEKMHK